MKPRIRVHKGGKKYVCKVKGYYIGEGFTPESAFDNFRRLNSWCLYVSVRNV